MVFRNCLGMIMSVSTLIIFSGAATPVSVLNFCMADILMALVGFMSYRPAKGQEPKGTIIQDRPSGAPADGRIIMPPHRQTRCKAP